jgi:hypothetical protein
MIPFVASVGEWSRTFILLGSHSEKWSRRMVPLWEVILSKFIVVSSFEEWSDVGGWCRTVISIGNGPDNHSLGKTHSLQVSL